MRCSESRWQARAKACRGASARATDSSRLLARRASTRSAWRTATREQLQVMTSPSSFVPGATAGRPLGFDNVDMVRLLRGMGWEGPRPGRVRPGWAVGFEGSKGQHAADRLLGRRERADGVHLVADEGQVAGLAVDDQGDQPGLHRALPGQE